MKKIQNGGKVGKLSIDFPERKKLALVKEMSVLGVSMPLRAEPLAR